MRVKDTLECLDRGTRGYLNVSCLPPHERHIQIRYRVGIDLPKKSFIQFNIAQDEDLAASWPKKPPPLAKKLNEVNL